MRQKGIHNLKRQLPRMTWTPENLYNIWQRSLGPANQRLQFNKPMSGTLYQKRWLAKKLVRAYHGDFLKESTWKKWYMLETLPNVRPTEGGTGLGKKVVGGGDKGALETFARRAVKKGAYEAEEAESGLAPVGSLMFSHVERRIDVVVFRSCFAHSVYEARRLVIHGYVMLNGKKHSDANTRLKPGDMISVDPNAIRFFKEKQKWNTDVKQVLIDKHTSAEEKADKLAVEASNRAVEEAHRLDIDPNAPDPVKPAVDTPAPAEPAPAPASDVAAFDASPLSTLTPYAFPPYTQAYPSTPAPLTALTPFHLPAYASPFLFIPAYIEVSFTTCSAIYVRHPTARPNYSEVPTPYDADGDVIRFAWEWYAKMRPRIRSKRQILRMPEDRAFSRVGAVHGLFGRGGGTEVEEENGWHTMNQKRLIKKQRIRDRMKNMALAGAIY